MNLRPILKSIEYSGNYVKYYGKEKISYPNKLRLKFNNKIYESNNLTIENVQSGGAILNNTLFFEVLDEHDNIIPFLDGILEVSIEKPDNPNEINKIYEANTNSKILFNNISQNFIVPDLFIVGSIFETAKLIFKTKIIKYLKDGSNIFHSDYQFELNVKFRDCIMGIKN